MKAATFFPLLFVLVSQLGLVSALSFPSSLEPPPEDDTTSTTTYIVELASSASNFGERKRSLTPHQDFYEDLRRRRVRFHASTEWDDDDLFVGVVITITSPEDLLELSSTTNVVAVRPVTSLHRPELEKQQVVTGPGDPELSSDTFSTHVMTGVDKVHAQGNFGQGVNIGIIDTGVDYLHPFLGGGFGPQFVVKGGYDFVGDAYTGSNTPVPDNDPLDTCNVHGTHIAGIIAAQPGNVYNATGVAYKSNIYAYRVFGCSGNVKDPIVIDALIKAYRDGCDVITLSLGISSGWTQSTIGVIASRIAAKGKVVSASIGNKAAIGAWYPESPSTGKNVIAVGSVDNTAVVVANATVSDRPDPISYFSYRAFPVTGSLPIYATSTDVTIHNDACDALPADTPDLSGYLVVIRRGGCALVQKLANAAAKGGRYFFIYNNGSALGYVDTGNYIAALIRETDGVELVNGFVNNVERRVSFPPDAFDQAPVPGGGLVSFMSSIGPSYDMHLKPSILAPGSNILSTFPRAFGSFGVMSGTSMSTPFIAGAAALVIKEKGKGRRAVKSVKGLLQNTAGMVSSSESDDAPLATVAQQGAGLVNVYNAISSQSVISSSELLINDTEHSRNYKIITISNPTSRSVTYTITHSPALTISTIDNTNALPYTSPLPSVPDAASVSFTSTRLRVWPRFFGAFIVSIRPPTGVDASTFPVYSGFIGISSSLGETFSVPYLGVAAKMKDMSVLDTSSFAFGAALPILLDSNGAIPGPNPTYTLQGNDYPAVLYRRAAGTPSLLADLVSPDIQLSGLVGTSSQKKKRGMLRDWISGFFGRWGHHHGDNSFDRVETVGPITDIPYTARHVWNGSPSEGSGYDFVRIQHFLNSTAIPNGSYKLLLRTLKITGNPTKQEDYESWLSPVFTVYNPSASAVASSTSSSNNAATAEANSASASTTNTSLATTTATSSV